MSQTTKLSCSIIFFFACMLWPTSVFANPADSNSETAWINGLLPPGSPWTQRLINVKTSMVNFDGKKAGKVTFSYKYQTVTGTADLQDAVLLLPLSLKENPKQKLPVFHWTGYHMEEELLINYVQMGYIGITPDNLKYNPCTLGPVQDTTLLHIDRQFPFVDPARIFLQGGSAGGFAAMMCAAESFPVGAMHATAPVFNMCYNGAYFIRCSKIAQEVNSVNPVSVFPTIYGIRTLFTDQLPIFGPDTNSVAWYNRSALAHLNTITCPSMLLFWTDDMLVPMEQVDPACVVQRNSSLFPARYTTSMIDLVTNPNARLSLREMLHKLNANNYEFRKMPVPDLPSIELPYDKNKQLTVILIEEGPLEPAIWHTKGKTGYLVNNFMKEYLTGTIQTSQLSTTKLERLMDRYAGITWLNDKFHYLDFPQYEKRDVLLGLLTYVSNSGENADNFLKLYNQLKPQRQVLAESVKKANSGNIADILTTLYKDQPSEP